MSLPSSPPGPGNNAGSDELQRQIAELQAQLAALQERARQPLPQSVDTHGGASVAGPLAVDGHFIGRDFIQVINGAVHAGEDAEDARAVIAHYLAALASDLAGLRLGEIDVSASDGRREPLQLADVYVPLDTRTRIPQNVTLAQWLQASARAAGRQEQGQPETRAVSALEALATHRRLTLLGAAGSGKSTFGASVLLALAQAWQGNDAAFAGLGEQWTHGALLPIRVVLRRFAEQVPAGTAPVGAGDLWDFIGRELHASGYGLCSDPKTYVQRVARMHGALFVLDGLDECGSDDQRRRVVAALEELMRSAGARCRFLCTARPYAWPSGADPRRGVYALADFDEQQVETFIAWYATLARRAWLSRADAERKRDDLLAVRSRADLLPLTRNPLLLTLMASLHANRGRLPDDRADLYNDSVDLLMLRWNRQIGADQALLDALAIPTLKLADLREVLEELAFTVHAASVGAEPDLASRVIGGNADATTADIAESRLLRAFRPLLDDSWDKAAIVVDYIEKRAGLLLGQGERQGERQFAFPHRTFQEFLAACHLAARPEFAADCARLARQAPGHWQLVVTLAARIAKAERGTTAADELIGGKAFADCAREGTPLAADWTCALLAGMQLLELGVGAVRQRERTRAIATRVADWLVASLPVPPARGGVPIRQRALAGDVLARLGDPRRHLLAVDHMRFAYVPRGAFWMGEKGNDGAPLHRNETLDYDYWLAQTPVTVAQFAEFVSASGYDGHEPAVLDALANRAAVNVSWYAACAFCAWLNERWRERLPPGWIVSLPSEAEWEKAARGGVRIPQTMHFASSVQGFASPRIRLIDNALPRRRYPWGDEWDDDKANAHGAVGAASTPGVCSGGCSPYGCEDLAGNVWEWTRSLWGERSQTAEFSYPYDARDLTREDIDAPASVFRVVRGGSWYDPRGDARCAVRFRGPPGSWVGFGGFRVLLRRSPVSLL